MLEAAAKPPFYHSRYSCNFSSDWKQQTNFSLATSFWV